MCILYCTSCGQRSEEACSTCDLFPQVRENLSLHSTACNMVEKIVSDPKNHFPTTEPLSSSKGPLSF